MKIILNLLSLLILISLTTFIGCTHNTSSNYGKTIEETKSTNPQPTPIAIKTPYKDGTFTGKSQISKTGQEEAIVTIKNGRISSITLKVLDISGKEINYSIYNGETLNNIYYPNINLYRVEFATTIIEKQTTNIPDIKEIPEISNNWKSAVNNALIQSKESKNK